MIFAPRRRAPGIGVCLRRLKLPRPRWRAPGIVVCLRCLKLPSPRRRAPRPCASGAATLCRTLSFWTVLQDAACEAPADLPRPKKPALLSRSKIVMTKIVDDKGEASYANLNPNLRKSGQVSHCPSSDGESGEANYVDSEHELLYGRDDKGEASYRRTHDSRRSDLDDDYSALSASAGGQSKGAGPKVLFPSLCSPCSNCAA